MESWKVQNLTFTMNDNMEARDENSFSLKVAQIFPEEDKNQFVVIFDVNLKDVLFDIELEAAYVFTVDEEITEDFKFSDFPKINAPAIAFPYIRSYISYLTLQSGFEPVILPSINFVKLAEED